MTLNQEEKKKLRANIEKIDAYIKSEICPYLHGSSITVDFGEERQYPTPPYREAEYHLSVYKDHIGDHISGRTGNLGLSLLSASSDEFGRPCSFDTYTSAGVALLRHWTAIKQKLQKQVLDIVSSEKLLDTFEV